MTSHSMLYAINRLKSLRPQDLHAKLRLWLRHAVDRTFLPLAPQKTWQELGAAGPAGVTSSGKSGADLEDYDQALCRATPEHWWNDGSFWTTFSQRYRRETESILARARAVANGSFLLFQWKSIETKGRFAWSETLESDAGSERWPEDYYSAIKVLHDPLHPQRDIKWSWELNRFQHLLWLGAAWRLTGEELFAQTAREHVESWLAEIRYPYGVQWNSNLEVALRALSWARCHILCRNSPAWSDDFLRVFLPALHVHGVHVERELTVHRPQSNHLLGEASALMMLGRLYPLFKGADRWLERGTYLISDTVPRLILPDGVYAEQSTGYLRFVAELLIEMFHFAGPQTPQFLSGVVKERLFKALRFVGIISCDPADVPMIGDSDTGRAIGWQISDFWDVRWLLAAGSVLLGSPELADGVEEFPAEAYLLLGGQGRDRFVELRGQAHEQLDCSRAPSVYGFPSGGYKVSRDDSFHIVFDCGPPEMEPTHAHRHCEALSFNLSYEGRPLFVDPGTYAYNCSPDLRHYFRSSSAHNTVRIDDRDPAVPFGPFGWTGSLKVSDGPQCLIGHWRCFRASIELGEVQHERFVLHLTDSVVLIVDHLLGSGEHDVESNLHPAPSWQVGELEEGVWSLHNEDKRVKILRESPQAHAPHVLEGSESPMGGWYSRYYGQKVPSPTLRWSYRTALPTVAVLGIKPAGYTVHETLRVPRCGLPEEAVFLIQSPRFRSFLDNSA